jgi:methionine aminotransferase
MIRLNGFFSGYPLHESEPISLDRKSKTEIKVPMKIESKLPQVGVTIFAEMSRLAGEYGAVNLSQGFPDFDTHDALKRLVGKYMDAGYNQYAPMQGVLKLRQRIAAKIKDSTGAVYDPETEVTVTTGATEAMYASIAACVRPGDEVILFEPAYDAYEPLVRLNGGVPVYCKLRFPSYRIDWDRFADAIGPATRMILINTPHNPTGMVLSAGDLEQLAELTRDRPVFIASDEVYEHIVFDGVRHLSVASHPELARRSFIISSFAKTYHTTGWKVGYCLAPRVLTRELQKVHQFLTFSVNTPIQYAYAEFMQHRHYFEQLPEFYQKKRELFLEQIENSLFRPLPCQGTYYVMLDYSAITGEPDVEFARRLLTEHGVAAIPPSVFYHQNDDHNVLRFCFAKSQKTLEAAAEKLRAIDAST